MAKTETPTGVVEEAVEPRYHVPRSQVWGGSRGGQSGHVHLHVTESVTLGRISRMKGQALCGKRGWYERPPQVGETVCPRCKEIAARFPAASSPPPATTKEPT